MGELKKVIVKLLFFLCPLIACIPSLVFANQLEEEVVKVDMAIVSQAPDMTVQEMQKLLNNHLTEWNKIKPALEQLIQSHNTPSKVSSTIAHTEMPSVKKLQKKSAVAQKVKIGLHLASYKNTKGIKRGWKVLSQKFTQQLSGKSAFYYQLKVEGSLYTRLVVGTFDSSTSAQNVCKKLQKSGQYCRIIHYKISPQAP